jgi:DNA-binding response OmpR family regulator
MRVLIVENGSWEAGELVRAVRAAELAVVIVDLRRGAEGAKMLREVADRLGAPAAAPRTTKIVHGPLTVDSAARRAFLRGQPLALMPREWAVLGVLLERRESVVSKETIGELIGERGKRVSANAVETHVCRLRAKLEPAGIRIRTVHRFGYLLEAATLALDAARRDR